MTTLASQPRTVTVPRVAIADAVAQVAVAAAVALATNVVVLWFATALGVSFQVIAPQPVSALAVAVMTVLPLALGGTAVVLAARRRPVLYLVAPWVGLGLALLSTAGAALAAADAPTAAALAVMHLVVSAAWVAGVRRPATRRPAVR
jgi:hypothetical protein